MARQIEAAGNAGNKLNSSARSGWKFVALFALITSGGTILSGCAGLATTSNVNPTAQETVQISPSNITFSNVAAGQRATQTAVLTNTGSEAITVSQLSVSSTQFAATGLATPLSLGPGQSTKFQIAYTGSTSGATSGTLSAMTSHGGGSTRVKLNGSSSKTLSQLTLSATSLNFGNVLVNGSSTQAVTIKNSGQTDMQITQIAVTGAGFGAGGVATPLLVPAGQSVALQATFAP